MNRLCLLWLCLCLVALPLAAEEFDGLEPTGKISTIEDPSGPKLDVYVFRAKDGRPLVGFYTSLRDVELRLYMDEPRWTRFREYARQAREQWETLQPRELKGWGKIDGYKVRSARADLNLSMIGSTALNTRQLIFSVTGGSERQQKIVMAFSLDRLQELLDVLEATNQLMQSGRP